MKDLLDMAERGDIIGVVCVTANRMGKLGTGWSGAVLNDVFKTIVAIEHLKLRFMRAKVE